LSGTSSSPPNPPAAKFFPPDDNVIVFFTVRPFFPLSGHCQTTPLFPATATRQCSPTLFHTAAPSLHARAVPDPLGEEDYADLSSLFHNTVVLCDRLVSPLPQWGIVSRKYLRSPGFVGAIVPDDVAVPVPSTPVCLPPFFSRIAIACPLSTQLFFRRTFAGRFPFPKITMTCLAPQWSPLRMFPHKLLLLPLAPPLRRRSSGSDGVLAKPFPLRGRPLVTAGLPFLSSLPFFARRTSP